MYIIVCIHTNRKFRADLPIDFSSGFYTSITFVLTCYLNSFFLAFCNCFYCQQTAHALGAYDGQWVGMGQREARGAFEDRVEVVGGVGMHISPEKKCDFANHPRTRAHGCLNRLFPLLIVVSNIRGVRGP